MEGQEEKAAQVMGLERGFAASWKRRLWQHTPGPRISWAHYFYFCPPLAPRVRLSKVRRDGLGARLRLDPPGKGVSLPFPASPGLDLGLDSG